MMFAEIAANLAERLPLPDAAIRAGMRRVIAAGERKFSSFDREDLFAREMANYPVAEHADAANAQHYELPPAFFGAFLGPRRKYSSCFYPAGTETLAAAEACALEETARHAGLSDGQDILELGCGWGSLTLWAAERFPASRIVAVSNSSSQRGYIEREARLRGLRNVEVVTADMNAFAPTRPFDRIVSVEMFEHMANWRALLSRARSWLSPHGRLFLHVFTHRQGAYRYDRRDPSDWIAQHFFTGGIMPSHGLIRRFPDLFGVEAEWRWNGRNYQRTALHWLANFDAARDTIDPLLRGVYGADAVLWRRRWRMFLLATAELFGFEDGEAWGISHYLLEPAGS